MCHCHQDHDWDFPPDYLVADLCHVAWVLSLGWGCYDWHAAALHGEGQQHQNQAEH